MMSSKPRKDSRYFDAVTSAGKKKSRKGKHSGCNVVDSVFVKLDNLYSSTSISYVTIVLAFAAPGWAMTSKRIVPASSF